MATSATRHPLTFFEGDFRRQAVTDLQQYFKRYTGSWFDRLADHDHPDVITARDVVAVSTLGVDIPAPTAVWLLGDGAILVTALLEQIPVDQDIWDPDADLTETGLAWRLWDTVRAGGWPEHRGGMGPTKTSKLLAAKRPGLIPIYDRVVAGMLFDRLPDRWWATWQQWLSGSHGQALREAAADVVAEAGVGHHLSVLRIVDVVVWMAGHHPESDPSAAEDDAPDHVGR